MATIQLRVNGKGLLDYAKAGKEAFKRVKTAMRKVLNTGRTKARQRISSEFAVRTGRLKADARKMQTKVTVKASEVKGQITPLPRLLNIFERGATLAKGRGFLQPRPVIGPASDTMEGSAEKEFNAVLAEVGK
jgi:hypothetical protein